MEVRINRQLRAKQWQDAINLILGIWLFISPWVFGLPFMIQSIASVFWLIGAIVFFTSAIALYRGSFREAQWIILLASIAMFLESLNRQMTGPLKWSGLIVGILMFILALSTWYSLRHA